MSVLRRLTNASALLAIAAVAVIGTGIADAATGGTLILGRGNTETTTAVLTNTKGTPLSLRAPSGKAPLSVNTKVKVPNLNADLLDGLDSTQLQRRLAHTIVVSPASTAVASGTALTTAYATAAANATVTAPWVVLLEPGAYDLNGASLSLHADVQLSGMGQDVTTVVSTGSNGGILVGHDGSVVTDLSVHAAGLHDGDQPWGYVQQDGTGFVRRITATADGGGFQTLVIGVYVHSGATLDAEDVAATASDGGGAGGGDLGVYVDASPNATLHLVRGVAINGAGTGAPLSFGLSVDGVATVVDTQIVGGTGAFGSLACVNSYDGNYAALNSTCG